LLIKQVGEGPYTRESLGNIQRLRRGRIPGYSCHGLRHLAGAALAEAGATIDEIMSVLGHTTHEMARLYVQQANRKLMAKHAISKWEQASNESG
jgi:integrase